MSTSELLGRVGNRGVDSLGTVESDLLDGKGGGASARPTDGLEGMGGGGEEAICEEEDLGLFSFDFKAGPLYLGGGGPALDKSIPVTLSGFLPDSSATNSDGAEG